MADTTKDKVGAIAPELKVFIADNSCIVDLVLDDVKGQVKSATYGSKQERAQRYLAAHHLTLIKAGEDGASGSALGPVEMEKVGDIQKKYSSFAGNLSDMTRYDETKYGRVYILIRKGCILPYKVFTP